MTSATPAAFDHLTVYRARRIRTMTEAQPTAEAVAVANGRIVAVGTLESLSPWLDRFPLTLAWTACNRVTINGNLRCPEEKVSLHAALRAITIDAAWILRKENEIGSIRAGKRADFAVLADDPYDVGAEGLRDITVKGVVFEGEPHPL